MSPTTPAAGPDRRGRADRLIRPVTCCASSGPVGRRTSRHDTGHDTVRSHRSARDARLPPRRRAARPPVPRRRRGPPRLPPGRPPRLAVTHAGRRSPSATPCATRSTESLAQLGTHVGTTSAFAVGGVARRDRRGVRRRRRPSAGDTGCGARPRTSTRPRRRARRRRLRPRRHLPVVVDPDGSGRPA